MWALASVGGLTFYKCVKFSHVLTPCSSLLPAQVGLWLERLRGFLGCFFTYLKRKGGYSQHFFLYFSFIGLPCSQDEVESRVECHPSCYKYLNWSCWGALSMLVLWLSCYTLWPCGAKVTWREVWDDCSSVCDVRVCWIECT